MVLTTHHMDEAETLCQRVAIMDHGKILQIGPPAALVRDLAHPIRISVESGLISQDEAQALRQRRHGHRRRGVAHLHHHRTRPGPRPAG